MQIFGTRMTKNAARPCLMSLQPGYQRMSKLACVHEWVNAVVPTYYIGKYHYWGHVYMTLVYHTTNPRLSETTGSYEHSCITVRRRWCCRPRWTLGPEESTARTPGRGLLLRAMKKQCDPLAVNGWVSEWVSKWVSEWVREWVYLNWLHRWIARSVKLSKSEGWMRFFTPNRPRVCASGREPKRRISRRGSITHSHPYEQRLGPIFPPHTGTYPRSDFSASTWKSYSVAQQHCLTMRICSMEANFWVQRNHRYAITT